MVDAALCYENIVDALNFDPILDTQLFAMLARDPYVEVAYIPARYKNQPQAIGATLDREVVVTEGDKTTRLPLEISKAPTVTPSPKLLAERPGKVRKPAPVDNKE